MRSSILKGLAVAFVVAGVVVPGAAAQSQHRVRLRLGLVPLQTAQLGPAGKSLALNYGSGAIGSDGEVSSSSGGNVIVVSGGFSVPGLLGGYVLDYGDPFTGSTGVTEIRSSVEEYKTRAIAKRAFGLAHLEEDFFRVFLQLPTLTVTEKRVKPLPVGQRRFGYLITQAAPNLNPIVRLDEQVDAGRFVLDLTVTAGSAGAAERIAPHLLLVLHRRLQLLLGHHATGTTPPLPREPQAGQAPGGPDLSTMLLQPTDVGQSHAVNLFQGYTAAPPALSDFFMVLEPAGTYDSLEQQIGWWPTATEAIYAEAYGGGGGPFSFLLFGSDGTATPVDVSSVGDNATGYLIQGSDQSIAEVTLTNGQAGESVVGLSTSALQASDVQSLAQAAANRLDAGLGP